MTGPRGSQLLLRILSIPGTGEAVPAAACAP